MSDLIETEFMNLPEEVGKLSILANGYVADSWSKNTQRSYLWFWRKFQEWCEERGLSSLPTSSETMSIYISHLAQEGKSFSTIDLAIASIDLAHKMSEYQISGNLDLYLLTRKGIRRSHKERLKSKQAKALKLIDLKIACQRFDGNIKDIRNKALVTLLYFSAMRRSELVSLDREQVEFTEKGLRIHLFGSKSNDTLEEIYVTRCRDLDICPVLALEEWINTSKTFSGPIFRGLIKGGNISAKRLSGHAVSVIMKEVFGKDYSGHSTRRGVITELSEKGVPIHKIQKISRHRSSDMVLRYSEAAKGYDSSASSILEI